VCDGDITRKERHIVLNENIKYVGLSAGLLPSDKICTVLNFAEYFYAPGQLVPDYIIKKFRNVNLQNTITTKAVRNINNNYDNNKVRTGELYNNGNEDEEDVDYDRPYEQNNNFKRKNSAKNYKDKELRYNSAIKWNNNETGKLSNTFNLAGYKYNRSEIGNKAFNQSFPNNDQHELSKTMPVNIKANKQFVNSDANLDELDLPDNVLSIKSVEKPIYDSNNNLVSKVIKKTIFYKDGNSETTIYKI
jgi:hypothetical protein